MTDMLMGQRIATLPATRPCQLWAHVRIRWYAWAIDQYAPPAGVYKIRVQHPRKLGIVTSLP